MTKSLSFFQRLFQIVVRGAGFRLAGSGFMGSGTAGWRLGRRPGLRRCSRSLARGWPGGGTGVSWEANWRCLEVVRTFSLLWDGKRRRRLPYYQADATA